jgi:hypothetical protein
MRIGGRKLPIGEDEGVSDQDMQAKNCRVTYHGELEVEGVAKLQRATYRRVFTRSRLRL